MLSPTHPPTPRLPLGCNRCAGGQCRQHLLRLSSPGTPPPPSAGACTFLRIADAKPMPSGGSPSLALNAMSTCRGRWGRRLMRAQHGKDLNPKDKTLAQALGFVGCCRGTALGTTSWPRRADVAATRGTWCTAHNLTQCREAGGKEMMWYGEPSALSRLGALALCFSINMLMLQTVGCHNRQSVRSHIDRELEGGS